MDEPRDYSQVKSQQMKLQSYADFSDVDLKEALLTIWRRKWLVFGTVVLLAGIATAVVLSMTPLYTAYVKVLLEEQRTAVQSLVATESPAEDQIQVISSRTLAQRVIDKLDLASDPEFNETLREEAGLVRLWQQISPIAWVRGQLRQDPPALTEDLHARVQHERLVEGFLDRLTVNTVQMSRVIEIGFTSEQPAKAARIADEIANTYLEQRLEAKFAEIQRTTGWLDQRIGDLRQQVQVAEAAVETFRRQSGLVESNAGETVTAQQVSELNTQLILARTARAEREARRDQVQRLTRSGGSGISTAGEVLNSTLINALIAQEVEVKRRLSDLSQEYGSRHPQFVSARTELADLQTKIRQEMDRIAENMQNEVNVARERERFLEATVRELETKVADSNDAAVTLRALERDANAARTMLETFLQQFQQFKTQDDLGSQRPDASIISLAAFPQYPSYPRKTLTVAAAIVIGGLLGVVLALLAERFESVFRSAEQVEQHLMLPVLGSVPDLRGLREVRKTGLPAYILEHPHSAAAEAVRSINARILHSRGSRAGISIQFASAEPEEGKSSLVISAAQMQGRAGRKVLLIDADFRHSQVARVLGLQPAPGLIDLMAKRLPYTEVLQQDPVSGVDVIVAGRFTSSAHDLLSSGRLAELMQQVRDGYDLILIDSPPVLSLSDAGLIADAVDGTVFVTRWGRTRKETARYAVKQLQASGGSIVGLVLSFVNVKRASAYTYGDSGQYYGKHQKYYVS